MFMASGSGNSGVVRLHRISSRARRAYRQPISTSWEMDQTPKKPLELNAQVVQELHDANLPRLWS
jgi:hypothetical protein